VELHDLQTRIALQGMSGPPQDRGRLRSMVSGPVALQQVPLA
jgi:hypothetical protein